MLLHLSRTSESSISLQIQEQVRSCLESRALRAGERLPSTRHLAAQLGVHRSTVAIAYQELWAQGWIELRAGACPRVRARLAAPAPAPRAKHEGFDWQAITSEACERLFQDQCPAPETTRQQGIIDFRSLCLDPRLMPSDTFRSCVNRSLRKQGAELLGYGSREGYLPLRAYLSRRLRGHGISATPEEIMVTNGSQHALDLSFRMLAEPGRRIAVESPTYNQVLPLLRLHGLKPVEIPLGEEGLDLSVLGSLMRQDPPVLVYTMPNFQNPTGISSTQAHREALLELCEKHGVPILEDGFEEEMKYFGKVILPIKAMDTRGLVLYCGTFSKVLFPGVRIGWVVASRPCIERLAALRQASELAPSMVLQAAMHEFCESGHYDLHLSRAHRVFRKRMQTALRALRQHIDPAWASWPEPNGGYILWLNLEPAAGRVPDWQDLFASEGVCVTPGGSCFPVRRPRSFIRLSIATLDEDEITEGIRRLGRAVLKAHRP